jgi:hypothetical protein
MPNRCGDTPAYEDMQGRPVITIINDPQVTGRFWLSWRVARPWNRWPAHLGPWEDL